MTTSDKSFKELVEATSKTPAAPKVKRKILEVKYDIAYAVTIDGMYTKPIEGIVVVLAAEGNMDGVAAYPDVESATKVAQWIVKCMRDGSLIINYAFGNKRKVSSDVPDVHVEKVELLMDIVPKATKRSLID